MQLRACLLLLCLHSYACFFPGCLLSAQHQHLARAPHAAIPAAGFFWGGGICVHLRAVYIYIRGAQMLPKALHMCCVAAGQHACGSISTYALGGCCCVVDTDHRRQARAHACTGGLCSSLCQAGLQHPGTDSLLCFAPSFPLSLTVCCGHFSRHVCHASKSPAVPLCALCGGPCCCMACMPVLSFLHGLMDGRVVRIHPPLAACWVL